MIDTKWKRLTGATDDPKQGIPQADVYQMMAYGQLYACDHLALLYPHHAALGPNPGLIAAHRVAGGPAVLQIMTIDLGDRTSIPDQLRRLVGPSEATARRG